SSPVFIAWRILELESARDTRRAAFRSLRVRGTFALALLAASASRRDGVGRPFFWLVSDVSLMTTGASGSDLVRRNNAALPGRSVGRSVDVGPGHGARSGKPTVVLLP